MNKPFQLCFLMSYEIYCLILVGASGHSEMALPCQRINLPFREQSGLESDETNEDLLTR